jgi:hypothetical protein
MHAVRSWAFTLLFLGAAWVEWRGAWWVVLPLLIAFEYVVTLGDSVVEDRYRTLTPIERTTHMLLGLNTGIYASLIVWQAATDWRSSPSTLELRHGGLSSWLLSACALMVAAWALRDGFAARRQRENQVQFTADS